MKMPHVRRKAQTFIFFLVSFSAIWLICGIGLDAGMLYLHRIKLGRAIDASILQGVALYKLPKEDVALSMKHMAEAAYDVLAKSNMSEIPVVSTKIDPLTGSLEYSYTFKAADLTTFTATLAVGSSGQITMSRASATSPARTFFMGYSGLSALKVYRVNATGEAIRRPRMIALVLDRSGSMLGNEGYKALPPAVTNFLSLFDTNADNIAIISYSSFARLEVPLTNKFNLLGTNNQLYANRYPQRTDNPFGMKFGGVTASDEGMRLAVETMMESPGWSNAQTLRFLVFFTDGQFNSSRTLWAAPAWTNTFVVPDSAIQTNLLGATSFMPNLTREYHKVATVGREGQPMNFIQDSTNGIYTWRYATNVNVWMQPGSVNYHFRRDFPDNPIVTYSYQTNRMITVVMNKGDSNQLVVPGYIVDGVASGYYPMSSDASIDYRAIGSYRDTDFSTRTNWMKSTAKGDMYAVNFGSWPDVAVSATGTDNWADQMNSEVRLLTMRNAVNLWSDPLIYAPDDYRDANGPINPSGTFYGGGAWYWPVDGLALQVGRQDTGVGENLNFVPNYASNNFIAVTRIDPTPTNVAGIQVADYYVRNARVTRMSTNMALLKPPADADLWITNPGITKVTDPSYWKTGLPTWAVNTVAYGMNDDGPRWRPNHLGTPWTDGFNAKGQPILSVNRTGGFMITKDSLGTVRTNINVMAWSGRPTHYFSIVNSRWVSITNEWNSAGNITSQGNTKTRNYCSYIRRDPFNVTIYTVGMGSADFSVLIPMANDNKNELDASLNGTTSTYIQVANEKQGKAYQGLPVGDPPTNLNAIFTKIANKILSIVTE
ncbi:MAG: VWA domain-containing protein [Candidatus Methylacidiphilales bacterium]